MIHTKHILSYCELCSCEMVICFTCGNNCCNGGYGTVEGKQCPDCPEAYALQDEHAKNPGSVAFGSPGPVKARKDDTRTR